jgi:uncharacterized membrane protein HdeD (DUF308 family)
VPTVRLTKVWYVVLALVLILSGLLLMDWVSFRNSNEVLGIGSILAGIFLLIDR